MSGIIRNPDPWRFHLSSRLFYRLASKGLQVPPNGWTAQSFAVHGQALMTATARMARLTQRKAVPYVAAAAARVFKSQTEDIIRRAMLRTAIPKSGKTTIEINVPAHEAIWMEAISQVFQEAGIQAQIEIVPPITSVMGQANSQVNRMLGQEAGESTNARLSREARDIAAKITRIDETTRTKLEKVVRDGIAEGETVTEVSQDVRTAAEEMSHSRSLTIARTELNNAWTRGASAAFLQNNTITHVSVIGCEAREERSPQFRGESTCNIEGVHITDLEELLEVGWHINHTGTLVPSGFRD